MKKIEKMNQLKIFKLSFHYEMIKIEDLDNLN